MNRRVWTGILAGVLAATVLIGVAGIAYNAGHRAEVVTRTVSDGEVVRVVGGYGYGWGHGPGGGFFLFPLLTVLLVFLLIRAVRGGRWGGGHGDWFEERHRRAHRGPSDAAEA